MMGGMGGGMGGPRYGRRVEREAKAKSVFGSPAQGLQVASRSEAGQSAQSKVRQIGAKTFYFKNGRWVDSSVKPEEDAKAVKIAQFSDDYFRIARTQKAEYNQYLSQSEPVTVKLEGTVYHIDPVAQDATR